MAQRREKTKVIYDILCIIADKRSIKPTPLLRFSNLSFHLFNEYMDDLKRRELVMQSNGEYSLTDKGIRYLDKYKAVQEFIDEFLL